MAMQKFQVSQTVTVEAEDVKQAAAKAGEIIRTANSARYNVVDRAGYTFNVETTQQTV
jgi:hypothetical protein